MIHHNFCISLTYLEVIQNQHVKQRTSHDVHLIWWSQDNYRFPETRAHFLYMMRGILSDIVKKCSSPFDRLVCTTEYLP